MKNDDYNWANKIARLEAENATLTKERDEAREGKDLFQREFNACCDRNASARTARASLKAENAVLEARIKELVELSRIKHPDFIYDQHDWENTYDIADFTYLLDGVPNYEVVRLQTLRLGPDVFAVGGYFGPGKWFYTEDEAKAYADQLRVKDGDE